MGAPGPVVSGGRLIHPPDTSMDALAARGAIRPYRDLPLPGLIDEPVADLELHRQDPSRRRARGRGLLLGPRFSHWRVVSSHEFCSIASERLRTSSRSRRALASC